MIKSRDDVDYRPQIDLQTTDGNAFALLGYAHSFGKQLGMSKEEIADVCERMQSGDYENLVAVFDEVFGEYVDIYR